MKKVKKIKWHSVVTATLKTGSSYSVDKHTNYKSFIDLMVQPVIKLKQIRFELCQT